MYREKESKKITELYGKLIQAVRFIIVGFILSEAYSYLEIDRSQLPITEQYTEEVLSIPLYNGMIEKEQNYVIDTINQFKPVG